MNLPTTTRLTIRQASEQLGLSYPEARRLVASGRIHAEKNENGVWEVDADAVANFQRVRRGRPSATAGCVTLTIVVDRMRPGSTPGFLVERLRQILENERFGVRSASAVEG